MSKATIKVGNKAEFTLIEARSGYGVYQSDLNEKRYWIVAKVPGSAGFDPAPPSSVLTKYETIEAAITALRRWAVPRVKQLSTHPNNQSELDLCDPRRVHKHKTK